MWASYLVTPKDVRSGKDWSGMAGTGMIVAEKGCSATTWGDWGFKEKGL